jgi:hypothetical protein
VEAVRKLQEANDEVMARSLAVEGGADLRVEHDRGSLSHGNGFQLPDLHVSRQRVVPFEEIFNLEVNVRGGLSVVSPTRSLAPVFRGGERRGVDVVRPPFSPVNAPRVELSSSPAAGGVGAFLPLVVNKVVPVAAGKGGSFGATDNSVGVVLDVVKAVSGNAEDTAGKCGEDDVAAVAQSLFSPISAPRVVLPVISVGGGVGVSLSPVVKEAVPMVADKDDARDDTDLPGVVSDKVEDTGETRGDVDSTAAAALGTVLAKEWIDEEVLSGNDGSGREPLQRDKIRGLWVPASGSTSPAGRLSSSGPLAGDSTE